MIAGAALIGQAALTIDPMGLAARTTLGNVLTDMALPGSSPPAEPADSHPTPEKEMP